jgi:hypothetical protein
MGLVLKGLKYTFILAQENLADEHKTAILFNLQKNAA